MTDIETALANCRALLNQINAVLSAKEPFIDVSSAAELLFYLEFAHFCSQEGRATPTKARVATLSNTGLTIVAGLHLRP
jgi:hypothetical protein